MSFSQELYDRALSIFNKELKHPFVTSLGDGTLPMESFAYYMRQDYIFLVEYCRVLALAASKSRNLDDMGWFARLLHETLNTEMELHRVFCREIGISLNALESTKPSPTTIAYTRHLLTTAHSGSLGEITAAMLPCQWGYSEIGQKLSAAGLPENPNYRKWVQMYSSTGFAKLAEFLRGLLDRVASECGTSERKQMEEAFILSTRYEYLFWDAAYKMEQWQV